MHGGAACLSFLTSCSPTPQPHLTHHDRHADARQSEGGEGWRGLGGLHCLAPAGLPPLPQSSQADLFMPFVAISSSWSLTAPSTHPRTSHTGFLVLFIAVKDGEGHPK